MAEAQGRQIPTQEEIIMWFGHPLEGAKRRTQRSRRYIEEAETLLNEFGKQCEDLIFSSYNEKTGQYGILVEFPDPHPDLPLAISDAVHNLRAALDYVVYELALKDSGSIQNGTQFPLELDKSKTLPSGNKVGWDHVVDRFMKGVNQHHRDMIEQLQPYKGVKWTKLLKDISNPDKHRRLTKLTVESVLSVWERPEGRGKRLPTGQTIYVDPHQTVFIELDDGTTFLLSSLITLHACVIDTISVFYREF